MPDLVKVTLRLNESDIEALRTFYPSVGYNKIVRKLVRDHVQAVTDRVIPQMEIQLDGPDEVEDIIE